MRMSGVQLRVYIALTFRTRDGITWVNDWARR